MRSYIKELISALDKVDSDVIENVITVLKYVHNSGGYVYTFGNGGSASTASHLAQDLSKGLGYRVICLNDSVPSILAYGNDVGFSSVFKLQLKGLLQEGDAVIGISCSGNSSNVVEAIEYASQYACTIGMVGYDGGKLKDKVDYALHVPINDMQICEDCHLILGHLIYRLSL